MKFKARWKRVFLALLLACVMTMQGVVPGTYITAYATEEVLQAAASEEAIAPEDAEAVPSAKPTADPSAEPTGEAEAPPEDLMLIESTNDGEGTAYQLTE